MTADHHKTQGHEASAKPGQPDASEQARKIEFMTARQLAQVLQVSESTIHRLRRAGRIPAVMLTSRIIRFNLRDVKNALKPLHSNRADTVQPERDQEPSPQLSFDGFYSDSDE